MIVDEENNNSKLINRLFSNTTNAQKKDRKYFSSKINERENSGIAVFLTRSVSRPCSSTG